MSVIPQTPRAYGGPRPLGPLTGLCPGPAGDLMRSPDPSPTHAPLITNPGTAPDYQLMFGLLPFVQCTLTGQNYFLTKIFPYIFHIKPLIFITFSWLHSSADFHEIFTFNSRIIRVYFNIFMQFFRTFIYKPLWFKHKCKLLTSQFYRIEENRKHFIA
jgi:hypothetical protein